MKKNLFVLTVATLLFMISCNKESAPGSLNSSGTGSSGSAGSGGTGLFDRGGGGSTGNDDFAGIPVAGLTNELFVFTNGSTDANWQGATNGFAGDVAINGLASERTSGAVPFAGTVYTNSSTIGAWQNIINSNGAQATDSLNDADVNNLGGVLENAFTQVNALTVTPGYSGISPQSLNGLNTENGLDETFVFDITSGFQVTTQINITGDPGDRYIFRWDTDQNPANGYNGTVKFQSGGAIVPHGGLNAGNFLHVAGNISSSGGGSNPASPYPQGPRDANGAGSLITGGTNFNGGGFFTGYWLTTGYPTNFSSGQPFGTTSSLSNAIFVGGWYSKTTKFSMTSGTSGVHIVRN